MKRTVFLLAFLTAAVYASAQESYSEMKFDTTEYDFGTFYRGDAERMTHTFTFTNVGNQPAVINQVSTSCGCTVATYTTQPVPPGKTGTVSIVYNAAGRYPGKFSKTITLKTNSKKPVIRLRIKGNMAERS